MTASVLNNRGSVKSALVLGAAGFIGSHLVKRLKSIGYLVIGVDRKRPEFSSTVADLFILGDLRDQNFCRQLFEDHKVTEVYQLAAEMGGAGFIFTGENDAAVMSNSTQINLNILQNMKKFGPSTVFFASSACVYPQENQSNTFEPTTREDSVYPANPDSDYGWEKLYAERLYQAFARNHGFRVRIARFHNVFGPDGAWCDGREKVPAALCRKVAVANLHESIEIWGDGQQTRSFLYIDDCIDGILKLMESEYDLPINIGSSEMVTINELARKIMRIANKPLNIRHCKGPEGVRGRTSDNALAIEKLNWTPQISLEEGLKTTYLWISKQVDLSKAIKSTSMPTQTISSFPRHDRQS